MNGLCCRRILMQSPCGTTGSSAFGTCCKQTRGGFSRLKKCSFRSWTTSPARRLSRDSLYQYRENARRVSGRKSERGPGGPVADRPGIASGPRGSGSGLGPTASTRWPPAGGAVAAAPTARSAQEPDKVAGCGACSRKREMARRRISVWNQGGSSASLVPSASRLSRALVQTRSVSVGVCRRGDQAALPDDYLKYSDERAAATGFSAPPKPVLPCASARTRGCGRQRTRSPTSGPGQSTSAADRFRRRAAHRDRRRRRRAGSRSVPTSAGCSASSWSSNTAGVSPAARIPVHLGDLHLQQPRHPPDRELAAHECGRLHARAVRLDAGDQAVRKERTVARASDPRRSHLHREDLRHRHAARGGGWSLFGGAPRLDSA